MLRFWVLFFGVNEAQPLHCLGHNDRLILQKNCGTIRAPMIVIKAVHREEQEAFLDWRELEVWVNLLYPTITNICSTHNHD